LNRHLGASLLRYLVRGEAPSLDKARVEMAIDRLFEDLARHALDGVRLERNAAVDLGAIGVVERSFRHTEDVAVEGEQLREPPDGDADVSDAGSV
jgi:hypothetical protein